MATGTASTPNEKPSSSPVVSNSSSGKLPLVLSIVNLLATLGMLAVLVISFLREKKHPSVEDISIRPEDEAVETEKIKEKEEGGKEGKEEEGKPHESPKKKLMNFGRMITLEQFTVNLITPGSVNPKYVRVNISLEVPNEDIENEVTSKMPQVRNVIIDLFNSKRSADLSTSDGRDFLKEEIRNSLNNFLVSGKIKGVYFTNFSLTN